VLTLAKITSAWAGGYAEYLEGKAQAVTLDDYYLKDRKRAQARIGPTCDAGAYPFARVPAGSDSLPAAGRQSQQRMRG
jgi:hypothetical protein